MRLRNLFALLLASLVISAHAADAAFYFTFSELLEAESARKVLDPAVKLYWAAEAAPDFAETAPPEVFTRSSITAGLFGGSRRHCVQAFEGTLKAMISTARSRGYDAIFDLRAARDRKPTDDPLGFSCKPGYKTTEAPLVGTFAMSAAARQRLVEAEELSAHLPQRQPAEGAIFLPLEPMLSSAQAQAILGSVNAYWGINAPDYKLRYGPSAYTEDVELGTLEGEEACRQAVHKALDNMVREVKVRDFDSIIKIRSWLGGQFTPVTTDVECRISKKAARVTLQFSMANKKAARD
jgi:hypothetical protein